MAIELHPAYYCDNFVELITHVHQHYHDLLSSQERAFYTNFRSLNPDAQKLYVRMLSRKGDFFRRSKLCHYQEISDCDSAALALETAGLIAINAQLSVKVVVGLFNRQEWLQCLKRSAIDVKPLTSYKRCELNDALCNEFSYYSECAMDDDIFQLLHSDIFSTYKLLFFGNLDQDLTEFVLRDLGIYRYANVTIDADQRLFQSRKQIQDHLDYYLQIAQLEEILASPAENIVAFNRLLPDASATDAALNRRLNRTKVKLARELERRKEFDSAAAIYQTIQSPEARERLARVYTKLEKIELSLSLCRQILAQPLNEIEAVFAKSFAPRVAKKYGHRWPAATKYTAPTENLALPHASSVERAVADHLSAQGQCYYSENAVFSSFFGLLYWDVIFSPYQGAFTHPFQTLPHDIYEYDFLSRRKALLGEHCIDIKSRAQMKARISENWQKHLYTASPFIYWNAINEDTIERFCEHIPLDHWQQIFDRVWWDLRENRSGFPDLCFFPAGGGYELIEVKGPGDRLQKNQLRWMDYFAAHDIPHKVINLEWI